MAVSASDTEAEDITEAQAEEAVPEAGGPTLGITEIKDLSEIISAALPDKKAEDLRTPRDKLTAAYLSDDLSGAVSAIKEANEAVKNPVSLNYDALTLDDAAALVAAMKTSISLEKPSGIFTTIQLAAGSMISWITYALGAGNYIAGILIFALILELAMIPLTLKQQKNSIRQASLKPKEMAIRKKYAGRDDQVTKNKINTEIQEMYQKENFNPMSGCLPMLIQLPIVIILYNVVINPIVYVLKLSSGISDALITFVNTSAAAGGLGSSVTSARGTIGIASLVNEHSDFFAKFADFQYFSNSGEVASVAQEAFGATSLNLNLFGLNFGRVPTLSFSPFDWLMLLPVLTFIIYFGSSKLTRKMTYQPAQADQATGCSNNIMDIGMPAFSVYLCFVVPAALGFYWMVKSVFGTVSRMVVSKVMPLPVFTEEDFKAAEKELSRGGRGASKNTNTERRSGATGKPVRSLHRIDDEDFEDTRERADAQRERLLAEENKAVEDEAEKPAGVVKNEDDRPMLTLREMIGRRRKKDAPNDKKGEDKDKTDKK